MSSGYIIALDVGERRIGVALASTVAALPAPLTTLQHTAAIWDELADLVKREQITDVVVGLPRGLDGQETAQTAYVRKFAVDLEERLRLPVHLQDEAGTSVAAETELQARGKGYNKGMVDAVAATIILEDYLNAMREKA